MDNDTLRKVQLAMLDIAKDIKHACEILGINYILDSGTLLGAVRHQGFIPWDDDLDIGMLRNDYEVFIKEAPSILGNKYFLQTWDSDSQYAMPFAKVRRNNSCYIEAGAFSSSMHNGIYVDVFPWDVFPEDIKKQKWQGRWIWVLKRLIMMKCKYTPWRADAHPFVKYIAYLPIRFLALFLTKDIIKKKYKEISTIFNTEKSKYYYEQGGASKYGRFIAPVNCFSRFEELIFENEKFKGPHDADSYLKANYGDYMVLPPEEKRHNRHKIEKIVFP